MTRLDEILKKAERFMEEAESKEKFGKDFEQISYQALYLNKAVYYGIRALYEQNKAVIELLKDLGKSGKAFKTY